MAAGLLYRSYIAVKHKKFVGFRRLAYITLNIINAALGVFLFIMGLYEKHNIIIGLAPFIFLISFYDLFEVRFKLNSWIYHHAYGMIFSGLLIVFIGTGFFGLRPIFIELGNVPFTRMCFSVIPFGLLIIFLKLYLRFRINGLLPKSSINDSGNEKN